MSPSRTHRLWRSAGLQVPRKRPRKRISTGRSLKCLTVIDEWTRECLAIDVERGIRGARVVDVLSRLVSVRGAPCYIRCDSGPEFVSRALLRWKLKEGIDVAFIDPMSTANRTGYQ